MDTNTPDAILLDPEPDADQLATAIAQHSDWVPAMEIQVRGLMFADRAIEREIDHAGDQLQVIVNLYKAKIEALETRQAFFRRNIEAYIKLVNGGNKVSWPDVGVAYMGKAPSKLDIQDEAKVKAVLREIDAADVIKTVEELDKRKLKAIVESTPGRFKDAARIVKGEESLRIRRS